MVKQCTKCGVVRSVEEFHRASKAKGGRQAWCKACRRVLFQAQPRHAPADIAEKECTRCHEVKPIASFAKSGTNKTGYHSYCNICMQAYYRELGGYDYIRVRQRGYRVAKRSHVRARKVALGCADCGDRREPVLEFHHLDPTTKHANVNALVSRMVTLERLDEEMDKCVVLCSNCHRMRHHHERTARQQVT